MKSKTVVSHLSALAGAMILLAGCGGGGGGGSATGPTVAAGGSLAGIAAKGILVNAKVTAYCGNSEAPADKLATGLTNAAGQYSLAWTTACAKPVMLVVTGDMNTTMADEATGTSVTPPAGFALRALVADPDTTAVKNITPFTDMAVAIAGAAASKDAISNAELAVVNTVLGGDKNAYDAKPLAPTAAALAAASADERKLATLLTAVSAFAQYDATCKAQATLADQIKCATDTFAAQAAATVSAVSDAGYTVAASVPGGTPATLLADTLAKIQAESADGASGGLITATGLQALSAVITSDTSGSAVLLASAMAAANTGGFVPMATAYGVQAARDLFNSLKNDLLALSDGSGTGYLDQKVSAMNADWTSVAAPGGADVVASLDALKNAIQMARDFKNVTLPPMTGLSANTVYQDPVNLGPYALETKSTTGEPLRFLRYFWQQGMSCYVKFTDVTLGKAGCYYGYGQPNSAVTTTFTGYYHAVEVAESTTASGTYAWQDYLASRTYTTTQFANPTGYPFAGNALYVPTTAAPVATSTVQTGTAVTSWTSNGDIVAVSLNGKVQPTVTGQDYTALDISGMHSTISGTSEVVSLTGTVSNVTGGVTTLSMLLKPGTQFVFSTLNSTSDYPFSVKFITQIKTAAFQYDGTFSAGTPVENLQGEFRSTTGSFIGTISTLSGGTPTEFLRGTLGASISNMDAYDPFLPTSSTNFKKIKASFGGKATNGTKTYEMTFIADDSTYGQESVTLNYSSAGSQMVSVTGTRTEATNTTVLTIKGTGNVNTVLTNGVGDVFTGTIRVGSVTKNPSQVNFTDGTYLLLGI